MNAVQRANRIGQIEARIAQLKAHRGQHEVRCHFLPRGISEPRLYIEGQRAIIAAIDAEMARLQADLDAMTCQAELVF